MIKMHPERDSYAQLVLLENYPRYLKGELTPILNFLQKTEEEGIL
jgi:hypothetical protein